MGMLRVGEWTHAVCLLQCRMDLICIKSNALIVRQAAKPVAIPETVSQLPVDEDCAHVCHRHLPRKSGRIQGYAAA
jgi:hypothetical protein